MGRGRAKAKQTKVARELKYASGDLDINALSAELSGSTSVHDDVDAEDEDDPYADPYADAPAR